MVAVIAILVYVVVWSVERRRAGLPVWPKAQEPSPPPRQSAPDDDEDFLRWLERKRRHDPKPPDG